MGNLQLSCQDRSCCSAAQVSAVSSGIIDGMGNCGAVATGDSVYCSNCFAASTNLKEVEP
jgi:hypothetical protein